MATPVVSLHRLLLIVVSLLGLFGLSLASVQAEDREVGVEPKQAARRVALVIGNGAYVHVGHLVNPINDATAMAKLFNDAGFATVEAKTDLGLTAFNHALADFEISARGADIAIVYYSGHGIEYAGRNYLIPVDAAIEREVDVKYEAVPIEHILSAVEGATRLKLIILDACRTDPFRATSSKRAVARGLAAPETIEVNELVAYSARAGTAAADGDPGAASPYTAALLKRLTTPGLDVELALRRVRDDVLRATHREQEPFYYGSMGGDELPLVAKKPQVVAPPPLAETPKPAAVRDEKVVRLEAAPDPAIGECDRLAASPRDASRPAGIAGVDFDKIDAARAVPACRAAVAVLQNDPRVAVQLGRALLRAGGMDAEAMELFRKGADAGHPGGMTGLGFMYEHGRGVSKSAAEAMRWYRKAADAGDARAMDGLGGLYYSGDGVTKDVAEAVRWYRKAADAGEARGMGHLGYMYEIGAGVSEDAVEAVRWYRKAADAGDSLGMNNLGAMYEKGAGVAKDAAEAVRWYRKAADAGNKTAKRNLTRLASH
jgi:TPR repeat protein